MCSLSRTAPRPSRLTFKYHVADVFTTDVGKGTGAGATQNRAKIFSNSDSVGEWVTIREVELVVGSTSTAPQSQRLPRLHHS